MPPAAVTTVRGVGVTTPVRTLLDLASVEPLERAESALDAALRTGLVSLSRLQWFVRAHGGRGRRGTKAIKRLLEMRPPDYVPPHSPLERRVWNLIVDAGLPTPTRQHEVRDGSHFIARVDLAYPDARIAVEADGYRWHSGRREWARDLARRNRLTGLGWHVLHVTQEDIALRPGEILGQLRKLLHDRTFFAPSAPLSEALATKKDARRRERLSYRAQGQEARPQESWLPG